MTAFNRDNVKIAIVEAGTNGADIQETDYILGQIKSYDKTGGEKPKEVDHLFGGDVDIIKPRDMLEISFDVVAKQEEADKWESMAYGSEVVNGDTVYLMSSNPTDKAVFIQTVAEDGTTNPMSFAFDNCTVSVLDMSHNADENQKKKLTLKFAALNDNGRTNFMAVKKLVNGMPNWADLPNGS